MNENNRADSAQEAVTRIWAEILGREEIGASENFFDLGGDSLRAMEVISRLRETLNVELPLIAFFEDPTILHLAEVIRGLQQLQPASPAVDSSATAPSRIPLSFAQLTFWLLQERDSAGYLYNEPRLLHIRGQLNANVLERSLSEICRRHDVLRTRYVADGDEPQQIIDPPSRVEFATQDFSMLASDERMPAALAAAHAEWRKRFDLSVAPPIRVRLLKLADDEHLLVIVMHHLVSDGHAGGIFFDELSAIYAAFAAGRSHSLPELPAQYADYALRQRTHISGPALEQALGFWRSHLEGAPAAINLPTDHPRPEKPTHAGGMTGISIPAATVASLKKAARTTDGTLFTVMLGALRILLARWTGQQDLAIGTVASNRSWAGSERMVGCFLNFLPLRNTVADEERLVDVLVRERKLALDAFAHQECPFVKIAAAGSSPGRDNPVYNVAFLLQNYPEMKFVGEAFAAEFLPRSTETALLDLRFLATEREAGLQLDCEFKTELYERETVEHLLAGFADILGTIVADATVRVGDVKIEDSLREQTENAKNREWKRNLLITATFTAEPVAESLSFWMERLSIASCIEFAPYNQVFQQLLDPASALSGNRDGVNIVLLRLEDWQRFEAGDSVENAQQKIRRNAEELAAAIKSAAQRSPIPIILCFCPSSRSVDSHRQFFGGIETFLVGELAGDASVHLIPSSHLMQLYPVQDYEDEYADKLGHIPYTAEFFTALGTMLARKISSLRRPPHKAIVLDCDNTLWRGVCGEEGPLGITVDAPYRALQEFMIAQQSAGMVLCLCSKNAEEDVTAVFEQNPGMLLRRQDIVASRINWEAKSQNLRELAQELQLGLDSFIFLDDNPLECEEVRANCPDVLTIQLPESPNEIPNLLRHIWALDHSKTTEEDKKRTVLYRENVEREQIRKSATSLDEFLAGLELKIDIRPMQADDLTRVAQLTERTNQFNFTTRRRTVAEIEQLCSSGHECWVVDLKDRFGDYGLVGLVIFSVARDSILVDTFLLSCRALGRKGEHHMLGKLGETARSRGLNHVLVDCIPTKKNRPALDFIGTAATQFKETPGTGTRYRIPAGYAASVSQLRFTQDIAAPVTEKSSSEERHPPTQTQALATIAANLREVSAITREVEATKTLRSTAPAAFVTPRTPGEEIVAGIWARLLKIDRVGIHDDFFALGGHSLLATQAVARIRQTLGVELPLRAMFEAPTVAALVVRVEEAKRSGPSNHIPPIVRATSQGPLPLSFAQQRLWFLEQLEPGNPLYNVPQMFRVRGPLQIEALRQSLQEITRRHEVLRTVFATLANEPVQVISPPADFALSVVSVDIPDDRTESEIERLAKEEAVRPFDLTRGPLIRATLLRVSDDDHALLITMHHIVSDRWSMGVLAEELGKLYAASVQGKPSPLPALTTQYSDFATWQRSWLQGSTLEEHLAYWKKQLSGAPAILEFPTDRPRPAVQTFRGATTSRVLPKTLVQLLTTLSQSEGVTLFMMLLAAFQTLLARYSSQEDIVVGSPIANRNFAEIEPLIGFFVNTLALRTDLSGDPTFHTVLGRVKEATLQAYVHQDIPFEKLVEELQPERSLSHNPIFQVMFALQNIPLQAPQLLGVRTERVPVYPGTSLFDMSWFAIEVPEGLLLRAEYNTDLFEEATIVGALDNFERLLRGITTNPQQQISRLPLIGKPETQKVLVEFNASGREYRQDLCVHSFLEARAESSPEATALIAGEQRISYRELNDRANKIAHYLAKRGAGPDVLIGIYTKRTAEMVAGIFGILKAGCAYVPLDPNYPKERLRFILEDAAAPVVLTQKSLIHELPESAAELVCLDEDWDRISQESAANPASSTLPNNLAFVLFTSGSTGRPKGVALEHRNAVNFIHWVNELLTPQELAGVLFCTSICFDMSTLEMFVTTGAGGIMILADDPLQLPALPARDEVTLINTVPSAMRELVRMNAIPDSLKTAILAGEALPESLAEEIHSRSRIKKLFNMYGPTETGYTTSTLVPRYGTVTIGRPIANAQAYVLDRNRTPQPVGVPGEIYLAGESMAQGYYGRPDLTAERFVPNPLRPTERMYRTGDLGRWLPDGNLQYLGRIDHQVKLRGFRIELGEIEAALGKHGGVHQALVMAREDRPGIKELVGYVVASPGTLEHEELRQHLKQLLPDFMVPSAFVILDVFPLTPNGKIDRKALPAPDYARDESETFVAPRSPAETAIAGIWSELLHLPQVGVCDNFFSLGGHSLLATQVISRLREAFHVELPLRSLFEAPTVGGIAECIARSQPGSGLPKIQRVSRRKTLAPSFAQQRLWFLDQLEPNTSTYNIPWTLRLSGALKVDVLEQSLNHLIQRHETLRTSFTSEDGVPAQIIHPSVQLRLQSQDLTGLPLDQREPEARRLIAQDACRPFHLHEAPLLRTTLMRLEAEHHILLINIHHIISDRWSMGVFAQELALLYDVLTQGKPSGLPELAVQYADFAAWQREWLQGEVIEGQLAYWKEQLKGAPAFLELPTDRPRLPVETFNGDVATLQLSQELTHKLTNLGQAENATLFMVLLAGFGILLTRHSGQMDLVLGAPIASRNHAEIEGLIGFFANTLPLRANFSDNPTFREALSRARESSLGAYAHQDMPFEKLVEELRPERSLSHNPLVQVFFILQNAPMEALRLKGLQLAPIESGTKTAKGELFFSMIETSDGLRGKVEYNTDLFDASTVERMLAHYEVLLEAAVANPALRVSELPLLTAAERQRALVDWNSTEAKYPETCLHALITAQAQRTPDRVAAVVGQQQLTYAELEAQSNRFARFLRKAGIDRETLIGLCVERSLDMLVALLGILKAGGAYVPLDPSYPPDRIQFILDDAQAPVLITQQSVSSSLAALNARVVILDSARAEIAKESSAPLSLETQPEDLAYVLYTSGSTGKPKGVQIEHRNLVNFLNSMQREPGLTADDTLLAVTTLSFDIAGLELYLPLITGAKLVLASREDSADGSKLLALLNQSSATVLQATPATWRMLLDSGWTGTPTLKALCGGEAMPADLAAQLVPRCAELWNMYGPTETTIWSSVCKIDFAFESTAPIGRPIDNTSMYVLDASFQPVPVGVTGELYIGGDGVARGYFKRPDLTTEKFLADPFRPGKRIYRTGDLAKFLPNGNLKFLGRADFQVKVRGFRIELGEIEAVLSQHPAVQQSVVIVREDQPGDTRLVAYIVPRTGQEIANADLRAHVRQSLPDYMVPASFVTLDALPLTPNGKIDRKALPKPDYGSAGQRPTYLGARTPTEEVVAGIWSEILKADQVSTQDDFFELGGHSLLATQVISRVRQAFQVEVPLRALFEAPTIAGLSARVEALQKDKQGLQTLPLQAISREHPLPLSFAQQRLWFLDQLEPNNPLYNISFITRLRGALNAKALADSLQEIVRRHESLRTTFDTINDEPVQVIAPEFNVPLVLTDLTSLPESLREDEARRLATQEAQCPFNLKSGPLLRALLLKLDHDDHVLILNTHHIISDRWSLGVLSQELAALYEANLAGKPSPLPGLAIQYADYAVWQRQFLSGSTLDAQLNYWKKQLAGAPHVLALPTDRPRQAMQTFWGGIHKQTFPPELVKDLRALSRQCSATFFMTMMAAFQTLLSRQSGQQDVVIGTDLANRTQLETEKLIGFFVNLLPIRTQFDGNLTFREVLQQVRQTSLGAFAHQDIPFDRLVEELRPDRSLLHHPLVQVLFVMQNTPQAAKEFGGLTLGPLGVSSTSRFDLVLFINDPEGTPFATWMYNPNLFDASTIAKLAALYEALLRAVASDPEIRIHSLAEHLAEEEKQRQANEQKKFQESSVRKLKGIKRKPVTQA